MPLLALHQVASHLVREGLEMAGQEEPTLSVQAAAYELVCGCGVEDDKGVPLGELLNTQLTELPRSEPDEYGVWVWVCPGCKFRHCFDGGEVEHAF